jgi:hypothetical protein
MLLGSSDGPLADQRSVMVRVWTIYRQHIDSKDCRRLLKCFLARHLAKQFGSITSKGTSCQPLWRNSCTVKWASPLLIKPSGNWKPGRLNEWLKREGYGRANHLCNDRFVPD